jgi:hypothetical protein
MAHLGDEETGEIMLFFVLFFLRFLFLVATSPPPAAGAAGAGRAALGRGSSSGLVVLEVTGPAQ